MASTRAPAHPEARMASAQARIDPCPGTTMRSARGHAGRLVGHLHLGAHRAQRVLHRAQVAGTVVEQRDHRSPLVEGSSLPSTATAARRARATALKMASTTWCRLRP